MYDLLKIIIGLLLGILLMFTFNKPGKTISKTTVKHITRIDTVKTKTVDTIYITNYIEKYNVISDTIIVQDSIKDYVYTVDSSDIKIMLKASVKGEITNMDIKYETVYPTIHTTDSILVTKSDTIIINNTVYKNKTKILLGASIGFKENIKKIGVNSSLQLKNNSIVYYQYNMLFDNSNTHELGIKLPINFNKK